MKKTLLAATSLLALVAFGANADDHGHKEKEKVVKHETKVESTTTHEGKTETHGKADSHEKATEEHK